MRKVKRTRLSFDEWLFLSRTQLHSEGSTQHLQKAFTELEKFCGPLGVKEFNVAYREIVRIASGCLLCAKQRRSLLPAAHGRRDLKQAGELLRKGRGKIIKNWALTLAVQQQCDGSAAEFQEKLAALDDLIRMTRSAAQGKGEPALSQFGFRPSCLEKFYALLQSYCLLRTFAGNRRLGLTKSKGPLVRFTAAVYRFATGEKTRGGTFSRSLKELRPALPKVEKVLAARRRVSPSRQAKPEPKKARPPRRRPSLAQKQRARPPVRGVRRLRLGHTRTGRLRRSARSRGKQLLTHPATP